MIVYHGSDHIIEMPLYNGSKRTNDYGYGFYTTESRDRGEKMEIYAKVGVQEYWLVDWRIPGGRVERYMLDDNGEKYLLHDIVEGEDKEIYVISMPNWKFTMKELLEHVGEDITE